MVALITEINFLTVLVAGSPRSTPAGLVSGKNLLLSFQSCLLWVLTRSSLPYMCAPGISSFSYKNASAIGLGSHHYFLILP